MQSKMGAIGVLLGAVGLTLSLTGCFSAPKTPPQPVVSPKNQQAINKPQAPRTQKWDLLGNIIQAYGKSLGSTLHSDGVHCFKSISVLPSQRFTVDRCETNDRAEDLIIVNQGSKEIARQPLYHAITFGMAFDAFDAFEADLDGDGEPELIVTNLDAFSNGIGVRYWTIYILPDPVTHPFQKPL